MIVRRCPGGPPIVSEPLRPRDKPRRPKALIGKAVSAVSAVSAESKKGRVCAFKVAAGVPEQVGREVVSVEIFRDSESQVLPVIAKKLPGVFVELIRRPSPDGQR